MSSDEPDRSVPDELFRRKGSAKPERQLPDALFGGPPPAPRQVGAELPDDDVVTGGRGRGEEPRSVPDELFKLKVSAKAERQLPDVLFGGPFPSSPVTDAPARTEQPESDSDASGSTGGAEGEGEQAQACDGDSTPDSANAPPEEAPAVETAVAEAGDVAEAAASAEAGGTAGADGAADTAGADAVGALVAEPSGTASAEGVAAEAGRSETGLPEAAATEAAATAEPPEAADATAVDADADLAGTSEGTSAGGVAVPEVAAPSAPAPDEQAQAPEPAQRPVLIVVADSLAYFGPKGGLPADHPRIWPNLVAAELDWDVELVGRIGWTTRDAYWALIGDPRIWAAVPKASALVFAVGGMDTLPSPLPTALREVIRYIRPPARRRVVRNVYNWLQPNLSELGRPVALPPKLSVDYLEQSRQALSQLRPDLPFVAVLPSVHNCDAYGRVHSGRPRAEKALRAWSEQTSVPLVDLGEAVRENIFSGDANPDGIDWGWDGHTAVANAMVKTLQEVR